MRQLLTTAGAIELADVSLILPHEHVIADLRPLAEHGRPGVGEDAVVRLMAPMLRRAKAAGVSVLVDATPVGVGRFPRAVVAAARAAGLPVVLPTGIYREPWIPERWLAASDADVVAWLSTELAAAVEGTDVPAGWVKLSAGDDGMTSTEERLLRAAARAATPLGAAIGSHTIDGRVVLDQLDVLADEGFPLHRFIAIHAQVESDPGLTRQIAGRGAWLSFDGVGWGDDDRHTELLTGLAATGLLAQLLVSQDRGWYDPALPEGGKPRPYEHIVDEFLPRLQATGWTQDDVHRLTVLNPFDAFARDGARTSA